MRAIKVGVISLNQTPLDWEGNRKRIIEGINSASAQQVRFLCFPELTISGYGCEDTFFASYVADQALEELLKITAHTQGIVAAVGLPLKVEGALYNAVAVIGDQQILAFRLKQSLANDGVYYEHRWFKPWKKEALTTITIQGRAVPTGDVIVEIDDVRLGFEICEEAWVSSHNRPGWDLVKQQVHLIFNPSASHFAFKKRLLREQLALYGSKNFGAHYVLANPQGNESGRLIFDGGSIIATEGEIVARGPRLSFAESSLVAAEVLISAEGAVSMLTPGQPKNTPVPEILTEVNEEFLKAVSLGLFDYLRKSKSRGFVVSLSGGVDSTAVLILAVAAIRFAIAERGLTAVNELLGVTNSSSEAETISSVVTAVYQKTKQNSLHTLEAARDVALELGVTFIEWSVDQIVEDYQKLGESIISAPLSFTEHSIALQNLQARVRAPGVWLVANLRGALLLSTSNRSEGAVGYCTMDGDTAGGLAPIAGVDKVFLQEWLSWISQMDIPGFPPLQSVKKVLAQPPSAELLPPEYMQTDENDLMPYPILSFFERAHVFERLPKDRILEAVKVRFPDLDAEILNRYLDRFFELFYKNQWKRERLAPSFHLDEFSLDPKCWARLPILR